MATEDGAPRARRGPFEKRGGYEGTHDPGRPTNLMQPQRIPATPPGAQGQAGPVPHGDAGKSGGTGASGHGSSGS